MKFFILKLNTSKIIMLILFLICLQQLLYAQENALYVTYGRQSPISAGDDNYKQAFFIKIPEASSEYFYVRIFDADCYGSIDDQVVVYNTETIFSLYGITDIFPGENLLKTKPNLIENKSGKLIVEKLYSSDFDIDNKWITFSEVDKRRGQLIKGYYYFKLIVEGGYGTDGNVYDIFISTASDSNKKIDGAELFSYAPTIRNNRLNSYAQIKFKDSGGGNYTQHNFDMDGAELNFETPYRSKIALKSSEDGEWISSKIDLLSNEKDNLVGINFARFKDKLNDVTIYITDDNSELIPLPLPIYYKKQNNKPLPIKQVFSTDEWQTKIFDASMSKDADGDQIDFIWDFGDGSQSSGKNVKHTYEKSGDYKCSLIAKDNSGSIGNSSIITFIVKVNQPPVANAGNDIVVSASEVNFDASSSADPDGKIIDYLWDFGDGSKGNGKITKHIYKNPGKYKVTLIVTDDSQLKNDKNSTSLNVIINKKPIADAGPDIITEPGKQISFSGINSIDPDGNINSFNWNFGDGFTDSIVSVSHIYDNPGKYNVTLTVKDNTNDINAIDIDEVLVIVNSAPVAVAGYDRIAAPDQIIEFNALNSFDTDGGELKYKWEFSDGNNKSDKPITKRSFSKPGLYKALLTVNDNSKALNFSSSDEINIRVNNSPTAIIGNDIFTCSSTIYFDASSSFDPDGDLIKYTWDFGDGSFKSNGIKVSHEYKTKGSFPVILTVDDGTLVSNSKNSTSISVIINQQPVADAGEDLIICTGEFVPFDGGKSYDPENGLLKYFWDFGDGTTAEGINPVKSFYTGGIFQVKLTVVDDSGLECNKDIDTKIVTVIESPIANAGDDIEVCAFEEVIFDGSKSTDADGVVNSYTWDFGDGTTGGGAKPKHTYTKAGNYKVVLSITGETQGDCDNSSADELNVKVNEAPEAKFSLISSAPVMSDIILDAKDSNGKSDNIISYNWDFGDSTRSNEKTVTHQYQKSGLYFIKLTVTTDSKSNCNSSSIINSILINESPIAVAETETNVNTNTPINFSALKSIDNDGAITSYKWIFGDGESSEGVYAEHSFKKPGKYNVTLEVKDNTTLQNNSAMDELTIEVYDDYKISFSSEENFCPGSDIKFSPQVSPNLSDSEVNFKWEFGDGATSDLKDVSHSFTRPGNYNVTLTANSELFKSKGEKVFSKNIRINSAPVIFANNKIFVCPGEEVVLDASKSYDSDEDIITFNWEIGNLKKTGSKISHSYDKPGKYNIKLYADDNSNTDCAIAEQDIEINVNSSPVVITETNIEGFTGGAYDEIHFDASKSYDPDGDAINYLWEFGDGEKAFGSKVVHYYNKSGKYNVVLKINDGKENKCSTITQIIKVNIKNR